MKYVVPALLCLLLAACGRSPPPPVVVYAYGDESSSLAAQFALFTGDTGIPVEVRYGASDELADDVIAKRGSPPADVLVTSNVADIWRAAEKGALRPIRSDAFDKISDAQKDPDRFWAAVRVDLHFIVAAHGAGSPPASWNDIKLPEFAGRLCLSSSQLASNRALIAHLMDDIGELQAERLVRRWIRNLALPPFSSQNELLAAVRDGRCTYGVGTVNGDLDGLLAVSPRPHYFDISAIGVARHAQQAESAQQLVGWFLENRTTYFERHVRQRHVSIAGWRDEEARLLMERAGYR
jgi:iron(III) transport system substrate-binding protein